MALTLLLILTDFINSVGVTIDSFNQVNSDSVHEL